MTTHVNQEVDIETFLEKMQARTMHDTPPEQREIDNKRMRNAVRNTYHLLMQPITMRKLVNHLYMLYLQGVTDGQKARQEKRTITDW